MSEFTPREGKRQLPAHIQAAIDRNLRNQPRDEQGRPADSAGVAWEGRDLSGPGIAGSKNPLHAFDTDDGLTYQAWTDVVEHMLVDEATEADAVKVLADIRVFAAVVPTTAETVEQQHVHDDGTVHTVAADKQADVALVSLESKDGRGALPVFTSVPDLTSWHPKARPVAVWMPRACLSAVDEGDDLVVVNPGAEFTFVVRRPAVWALAQQREWVPSYEDPEVAEAIGELAELVPGLKQLGIAPGSGVGTLTRSGTKVAGGGSGPELALVALPHDPDDHVGARHMVATLQSLMADHPVIATKVDSLEIRLANPSN